MPQLKDFRQTKEIALPSYPDSKVVIYDSLLVGQMAELDLKNQNEIQIGIKSLPFFIKSWNFTDEEGKPMPIDSKGVGFLTEADLLFLLNQITELAAQNKKKDTTTPK